MKLAKAERRVQLLEVALRLFSEHGFERVSTYTIAQEAGVTEGLIFHYFPTKLALFQAVIENYGFQSFLPLETETLIGMQPSEGLSRDLNSFLDVLWKNRMVVRLIIATAFTDPAGIKNNDPLAKRRQHLGEILSAYEAAGRIRPGVAGPAAHAIAAATAGFFVYCLIDAPEDWEAARNTFVSDLLLVVMEDLNP